jgi:hypothetical protein
MPIVIVSTTEDHLLLDPDQVVLESESRTFEGLDEPRKQWSGGEGCVTGGALS